MDNECSYRHAAGQPHCPPCRGEVRWRMYNLPEDMYLCDGHKEWATSYVGCNPDVQLMPTPEE